jgi:molybdenum cofactor guanylyltransferase
MPLVFSAVLLAAGRSTRMGRDKALLPLNGAGVLWQRQLDVLRRAGAAEVFLSARAEQPWAEAAVGAGFAGRVHDAVAGAGPLAGIVAAMHRAAHPHVAVLAIDLPRMPPEWFTRLQAVCAPGVGGVGCRGEGFEPLAAIYPRELLPQACAALAAGELSLQRLLRLAVAEERMRVLAVTEAEAPWFENWNERAFTGP